MKDQKTDKPAISYNFMNRTAFLFLTMATILNISAMQQNHKDNTLLALSEKTEMLEYLYSYHPSLILRSPSLKEHRNECFKEEYRNSQTTEAKFKAKLEKFFAELKNGNKNAHQNYPWLFHEAVWQNSDSKLLMNLKLGGYDINKKDYFGFTPLLLACKFQYDEIAESLLYNIHDIKPSLSIVDPEFISCLPIHHICQLSNNTKLLKALLLSARENNELDNMLNAKDDLGNNALHTAISSNKKNPIEFAKILIAHGADINKPSATGHTPLTMSLAACEELLPWLIEKGASPNQTIQSPTEFKSADGGTPILHLACRYNKPNAVKLLLEKGADPNKMQVNEFSYGNTALHIASSQRSSACVEELLKSKSINVNALNKGQNTPLHEACASSNPNINLIKKLISAGAHVNVNNIYGLNPLTSLCNNKFNKDIAEIARYLLKNGSQRSYLCLHQAVLAPEVDKEMINFLLEQGWNINEQDSQGNTILHKLVNKKQQCELRYSKFPPLSKYHNDKIIDTINFLKLKGAKLTKENNGERDAINLEETLKKESERDHIIPRAKIKVKNGYSLICHSLGETEEEDYTDYSYDQLIISQKRNNKEVYIRVDNTSPFMMQPCSTPIVTYKQQDVKREKENDFDHNFSLIVDNYIGSGIYVDSENQNDPIISRLCKLLGFKPIDKDHFAVLLQGKIYGFPCDNKKLVPNLLEKKGINGAFIYLFKKDSKTCFHRKFHAVKQKEAKDEFKKCFEEHKKQTKDQLYVNLDPKKNPALLFNK